MDKNFKPYITNLLKYAHKLEKTIQYHNRVTKSVTRVYLAKRLQNLTIGKKSFVPFKINTLKYFFFYLLKTLVDGSFKHYKKIVLLLGLNSKFNMELINIEEWSAACLDNRSSGNCC